MATRRWLKIGAGVAAGVTTIIGLFILLSTNFGFVITDLTGDIFCEGTYENPCVSQFTVRNPTSANVDIYSKDQVKLDFNPYIEDWALFVPDGRCSATGKCACDLEDGSRLGFEDWRCVDFTNKTKPRVDKVYNFRFKRYSTTTFLLAGIKRKPASEVKWTFGVNDAELDPKWKGITKSSSNTIGKIPRRQIVVESQDYLSEFITWEFKEINDTHWLANYEVDSEFLKNITSCGDKISDKQSCYSQIYDEKFEEKKGKEKAKGSGFDSMNFSSDAENLEAYPIEVLTKGIIVSQSSMNYKAGDGSFYIVFPKGFQEGERIKVGFGSVTIGSTTSLSGISSSQNPKLIIDPDDTINLVWKDSASDLGFANNTVASWTGAWTTKNIGVSGTSNKASYSLLMNSTGELFWLYEDIDDVRWLRSSDKGLNWYSAGQNIYNGNTTDSFDGMISAVIDANDNIHMCIVTERWAGDAGNDWLIYANYSASTGSWSSLYWVHQNASDDSDECDIAVDTNGEVYIIASGGDQTDLDIWKVSNGFGDGNKTSIETNGVSAHAIAIDQNNSIYIVYEVGSGDLGFANSTNNTWNTSWTTQTVDTSSSDSPDIAINSSGHIFLLYEASSIYMSDSADGGVTWTVRTTLQTISASGEPYPSFGYSLYPSSNIPGEFVFYTFFNEDDAEFQIDRYPAVDIENPQWSLNQTNVTDVFVGDSVLHSVQWTDDFGLDGFIFSFDNGTGTFVNDSFVAMTGQTNWSNVSKTINAAVGSTIRWSVWANDTSGNSNTTDIFQYSVKGYPLWSNNQTNSTLAGSNILFSLKWDDLSGLAGFIFGWHNGVNWTQISATSDLEAGTQSFFGEASGAGVSFFDTFEDGTNWSEEGDCAAYWNYGSSTPSGSTGPQNGDSDDAGSNFVYMETSAGNCDGTPSSGYLRYIFSIDWDAGTNDNITFETNRYGTTDLGTMTLEENSTGSWVSMVYSQTGDDGNSGTVWTAFSEDASSLTGTGSLRFYTSGHSSFHGDAAIDKFNITSDGVVAGPDANKTPVEYLNVITGIYSVIDNFTAVVNVDYYNTTGSIDSGNANATLWLEVYNGTGWVDEGDFVVNQTGNFSIFVDTQNILDGWSTDANKDIRISARLIDYNSSSSFDTINWSGVWVIDINNQQHFLNDSYVAMTGTSNYSNVTKTVTSTVGATIDWYVWANNTDGLGNLSDTFSFTTTSGVADTCTCPGAGNNWEVNMEDQCQFTSACTLTTGTLSWIGASGFFNCSAQLNLTNRNAPPSSTTFYFSSGCEVNRE